MNYRIRDPQVRVLDENGGQLGIMSSQDANRLADQKGLDLVKINPATSPPICKIMDYGKFKFDTVKREKELKRNSKSQDMREIRLSMNIDKHDMETKARQTIKLLQSGDKVKISIRMRGREQAHARLGIGVMDNFFTMCEDIAVVDTKARIEGRSILMVLAPKKLDKSQKSKESGGKATSFVDDGQRKKYHTSQPKQKPERVEVGSDSQPKSNLQQSLGDKLSVVNTKMKDGRPNSTVAKHTEKIGK